MGIRFACHVCSHPLNIKRDLAGRVGKCPQCHGRFRIPAEDAATSLPLASADPGPQRNTFGDTAISAGQDTVALSSRAVAAAGVAPAAPATPAATTTAPPSPLDDPLAQWYVRPPAGGQYGPAASDVIRTWIAENRITPSTLVWRQGWPQWRSARDSLPEMAQSAPTTSPVSVAPAATAAQAAAGSPQTARAGESAAAPVKLAGRPQIGQVRSARGQRRLVLVIVLAVASVCLLGLLVLIAVW